MIRHISVRSQGSNPSTDQGKIKKSRTISNIKWTITVCYHKILMDFHNLNKKESTCTTAHKLHKKRQNRNKAKQNNNNNNKNKNRATSQVMYIC